MANRLIELFTDPIDMVKGLRKEARTGMNIWGPSLLFPQFIGGVYFLNTLVGAVVLIGVIVMFLTAGYFHRHRPLSRLIGVCQAWWLLTIPWLFYQAMAQTDVSVFSIWLWYVVITIIVSLAMSAYGVHLYLTTENQSYRESE